MKYQALWSKQESFKTKSSANLLAHLGGLNNVRTCYLFIFQKMLRLEKQYGAKIRLSAIFS